MRIVGQEKIADLLGVSPKTIVEWQGQGLPIAVRGGPHVPSEYDSVDCITWLLSRELKKVEGEKPQDRLARMQADRIDLELKEKRGLLLPADQVEPRLRAILAASREMWRHEPARLAREVTGKPLREIEELLAQSYESLLIKMSKCS